MRNNINRMATAALLSVLAFLLCATAGAETNNIVFESTIERIQIPVELPAFEAEVYIPKLEQLEAEFDITEDKRENYDFAVSVKSGDRQLIYFPEGYFLYSRADTVAMKELLSSDLPQASLFSGAWLSDGGRESQFMTRDNAQKLVFELLNQYGVTDWRVDVDLYYIDNDDWQRAIDNNREFMVKSVDIDKCKEIYYAIARLSYDGVKLDDRDFTLLNERTVCSSSFSVLIDDNGILDAQCSYYYLINKRSEPKPLLGFDEAAKILDDYYGELYMSHEINICAVDFAYCAYPLSQTQYEIVPIWKFGIRGFSENSDGIREYVRINAINGRILE